jgi:hypothetical protein
MNGVRFSLTGLMAAIAFIAVSLAALRSPSAFAVSAFFTFTVGVLLCSTLAALLCRGTSRNFWVGFALFGWVYLFIVRSEPYGREVYRTYLLTTDLLQHFTRYGRNDTGDYAVFQQGQILHFLFTLVIAFAGGALANWLGAGRKDIESKSNQPPIV